MANASSAKGWAREHITGIWTSPLIVFDEQLELDFAGLAANVDHLIEGLGANGLGHGHSEPWCLSVEERKRSMEAFVAAVGRRCPTYVHATDHSAPVTVELVNHGASVGADAVMLHPPFEWAKTDDQIVDYYRYVADRTDIAIIVLNTPHSGRLMSPELIAEIAEIPAVCALKDGIQEYEATFETWKRCGDEIVISHPYEADVIRSIVEMGQQVQLGTSAFFMMQSTDFQPYRAYFDAAQAGDVDRAQAIYDALEPARSLWKEMYSVLYSDAPEHPIPLEKLWMDEIGMRGGPVRPPLHRVAPEHAASFRAKVREALARTRERVEAAVGQLG